MRSLSLSWADSAECAQSQQALPSSGLGALISGWAAFCGVEGRWVQRPPRRTELSGLGALNPASGLGEGRAALNGICITSACMTVSIRRSLGAQNGRKTDPQTPHWCPRLCQRAHPSLPPAHQTAPHPRLVAGSIPIIECCWRSSQFSSSVCPTCQCPAGRACFSCRSAGCRPPGPVCIVYPARACRGRPAGRSGPGVSELCPALSATVRPSEAALVHDLRLGAHPHPAGPALPAGCRPSGPFVRPGARPRQKMAQQQNQGQQQNQFIIGPVHRDELWH
jgi:hypothetical protein